MIKLLSRNLNILLKLNYYDKTIIQKFKYFIKNKLLSRNLNILLRDQIIIIYIIVDKFKYFIKIKLL
jgi:hypothetical protein